MSKILDPSAVLPHLSRWDTTRMFLLQCTPEHIDTLYSWMHFNRLGYTVTRDNLNELVQLGRRDIASFLIATVATPELLEQIVQENTSPDELLAVTMHRQGPIQILLKAALLLQGTPLAEDAHAHLAKELTLELEDVPHALAYADQLLNGPSENLPQVLTALQGWNPGPALHATSRISTLVLERNMPLNDETQQALFQIAKRNCLPLGEAIGRHAHTTTAQLKQLLSLSLDSAGAATVFVELLNRETYVYAEDFPTLWQANDSVWLELFTSVCTSTNTALCMLYNGGVFAQAALESGQVPDDIVNRMFAELLHAEINRTDPPSHSEGIYTEARRASNPELLEQAVQYIETDRYCPIATVVAQNPWLTHEQQTRLAALQTGDILEALASNTGLHPDVATTIVNQDWAMRPNIWVQMTGNTSLPLALRLSMPASVARHHASLRRDGLEVLVQALENELGDNTQKWQEFELLLPEWVGTIGDLAHALDKL